MKYFSVKLYRKMLDCAIEEGKSTEDFIDLLTPINTQDHLQVVLAEEFLTLHELLTDKLGRSFSVRVGQKMKIEDYGVLGLSWRTYSKVGGILNAANAVSNMKNPNILIAI